MNISNFFRNITSFTTITSSILKTSTLIVLLSFFTLGSDSQAMASQMKEPKYYPQCYKPISKHVKEIKAIASSTDQDDFEDTSNGPQPKNPNERFANYTKYLDKDSDRISKAMDSIVESSNCYREANKQLRKDFEAGKIPEKERDARKAAITSGVDDCVEIVNHYMVLAQANVKIYEEILKLETSKTTDKASAQLIKDFNKKLFDLSMSVTELIYLRSNLLVMDSDDIFGDLVF